ncbi:hypothetical protein FJTKL_12559 [Diaporthe vaccinii]|uniref:Uncharacterized protein n=1 Tax=Diaporthe vaccinii TaxID=105482 RepID=A0ABR4ED23_9PEZI
MAFKIVSILILVGFTFGAHVDQDNTDLEARAALPHPSWVDLGPRPFGGLPRQRDIVARKVPLETLITRESTSADITEQNNQLPVPLSTSSCDESLNERHGGEFYRRPKSSSRATSEGDYYPTAKPSSTSSSSEGYGEPFSSSPDYTHSHNFFGVYNDQHFYYSDDRQIHLGDNKGAQNKDNLSTVSSHQHYLCVRVHRNSRDRRRSTSDSNGRGYQRNIVNSGGYKAHKLAEHILLGSPE